MITQYFHKSAPKHWELCYVYVYDSDEDDTNRSPTAPLQGQEGLFIEDISNPESHKTDHRLTWLYGQFQ